MYLYIYIIKKNNLLKWKFKACFTFASYCADNEIVLLYYRWELWEYRGGKNMRKVRLKTAFQNGDDVEYENTKWHFLSKGFLYYYFFLFGTRHQHMKYMRAYVSSKSNANLQPRLPLLTKLVYFFAGKYCNTSKKSKSTDYTCKNRHIFSLQFNF